MKYLLTILTVITGLLNIAESSEDFLRDQNSYLQDQDDVSQYELSDSSQDLSDSSQDLDDSSQDLDDSSQDLDDSSHDITNNPKILNKYKTLKLIQDDEVNIQDITIEELLAKIEQCKNDVENITYDKNKLTAGDKDELLGTLFWILDKLMSPFENVYGYLIEDSNNSNLKDLLATICSYHCEINSFSQKNKMEDTIDSFECLIENLKEIPKQYLKLTVAQVINGTKQIYEQFLQKCKKKKVE